MLTQATEFVNEIDLRHKRLCHMSEKRMSILTKKNVLFGVVNTQFHPGK